MPTESESEAAAVDAASGICSNNATLCLNSSDSNSVSGSSVSSANTWNANKREPSECRIEDKAHTGASSEDCSSNTRSSGINNVGATADIEAAAADLSIDADSIPVVHNSSDSSAEGTGDRGPSSTLCTNYSRNNNGDCNRKEVMGVDKSSEEGKESSKNCGVDTPAEHAGTRGHHTVLKDDEDSNREDTSRSLVAGHSGSSPPNDGSSSCDCPEPSIFNSSSTDIRRDDHRFFSPEDRTSTGSSSEPAAPMEADPHVDFQLFVFAGDVYTFGCNNRTSVLFVKREYLRTMLFQFMAGTQTPKPMLTPDTWTLERRQRDPALSDRRCPPHVGTASYLRAFLFRLESFHSMSVSPFPAGMLHLASAIRLQSSTPGLGIETIARPITQPVVPSSSCAYPDDLEQPGKRGAFRSPLSPLTRTHFQKLAWVELVYGLSNIQHSQQGMLHLVKSTQQ
ncbi:hypothetical protein cyc_04284 [Cyclospora cayetanensis]|uniref:Uncharacterized protein n=1 Tax=Cyclospora cayetanensis TaxID=88456 RepID=A0A1D3D3D8_9EIME|nr:hypothetical protein cyc_04284 [Cyclospora cayetanensis]